MGPRGPKISDAIKREIALLFKHGAMKAPKVLASLKQNHKNDNNCRLPGKRAIEIQLKAIKDAANRIKKEKLDPDCPWSLGVSQEAGIPPEATTELLRIWWWTVIVGYPLTVREARWLYRLRGLSPAGSELNDARLYGDREWVAEVMGKPIYTSDLDAHILASRLENTRVDSWVLNTAVATGNLHEDNRNTSMMEGSPSSRGHFGFITAPEQAVETRLWVEGGPRPAKRNPLSYTASCVYSLWLRKVSSTSIWRTLLVRQQAEIMERLRELVKEETRNDKSVGFYGETQTDLWKPNEILKKFGLSD
ncbi:MAG: hypothetical protein HW384_2017 [Dehalococcoidia bacterium]|nr:hypothetical protein [Dehalococcoidia bacterium]